MRNWFRKDGLSKFERDLVRNVEKHDCPINGVFGTDGVVRMVHPSQIDDEILGCAIWYHRTQMDTELQSVAMPAWPDANGVFPWEIGCQDWVKTDQPAIYEPRLNS